jgi:hypothetical protein
MPEQEVSMEEYAAQRTASRETVAATTPQEKVTTASESAPDTPESEEETKKVGGGWQRRIDKLTKRNAQIEADLQEERAARQRLEARQAGRDPKELAEKVTDSGSRPKPKPSDLKADGTPKYADFDAYLDDRDEWVKEQAIAKVTEETKKAKEQEAQEKTATEIKANFEKRAKEYIAAHPDAKELIFGEDSESVNIPPGSVMDVMILKSENAIEILAHLCNNPDEISRIAALDPLDQAEEMFKIKQLVGTTKSSDDSPQTKKASLPAPIKPLSTGTSKSTVPLDKAGMDDYVRARKAGQTR